MPFMKEIWPCRDPDGADETLADERSHRPEKLIHHIFRESGECTAIEGYFRSSERIEARGVNRLFDRTPHLLPPHRTGLRSDRLLSTEDTPVRTTQIGDKNRYDQGVPDSVIMQWKASLAAFCSASFLFFPSASARTLPRR